MIKRAVCVWPLLLVALVAGCSMFSKPDPRPCPRVSVLNEAQQVTQYRPGPGRDLTDVAYVGEIGRLKSQCHYEDNQLTVGTEVTVLAERGPAADDPTVSLPVFIAVTGAGQDILAKEVFDTTVEFPSGLRQGQAVGEYEQSLHLKDGETGANYEIIVGFQLTKEQLEMNRPRR